MKLAITCLLVGSLACFLSFIKGTNELLKFIGVLLGAILIGLSMYFAWPYL